MAAQRCPHRQHFYDDDGAHARPGRSGAYGNYGRPRHAGSTSLARRPSHSYHTPPSSVPRGQRRASDNVVRRAPPGRRLTEAPGLLRTSPSSVYRCTEAPRLPPLVCSGPVSAPVLDGIPQMFRPEFEGGPPLQQSYTRSRARHMTALATSGNALSMRVRLTKSREGPLRQSRCP